MRRARATLAAGLVAAAAMGGVNLIAATPAAATAGNCISFLEEAGMNTTLRGQICTTTETVGNTLSQAVAHDVCLPLMNLSFLPPPVSAEACGRAVAPY